MSSLRKVVYTYVGGKLGDYHQKICLMNCGSVLLILAYPVIG